MKATLELGVQRRIDHPVRLDPALAAKRLRFDRDPKMSLAFGPGTGMALVQMRFIDHIEVGGFEDLS